MMDSLPYRNDAAVVLKRLIRSLPLRRGVIGVATCDKGLPAMMMALAAQHDLPTVIVPGGVTLPALDAEDAGKVQSIGARFAEGDITREYAADMGCRACGSAGGGCQFLGTAATSQVVAEALGLALPHTALAPSGQPIWLAGCARQAARPSWHSRERKSPTRDILTDDALDNALAVHAACGGSTNLLLHIPAVAFEAGLRRPDGRRLEPRQSGRAAAGRRPSQRAGRPSDDPPVSGRRRARGDAASADAGPAAARRADGQPASGWDDVLEWWERSDRRTRLRELLKERDGVDADDVIMAPAQARSRGLTSTVTFPQGNIAPEGSVIKSTSIDPQRGRRRRCLSEDRAGPRLHQ